MNRKPEIYQSEMDDFAFLTETEIAFLGCGSEPMKKMILQRAKMFKVMFNSFMEYNPKEETFKLLNREEWKKKIGRILNLQFKLDNLQAKGVIDLFWQRVDVPKGGLKGGTK